MPKVSEEYFENKRRAIVEAAYRVCLRKPVGMVNMMDVIEETGLSQGGIYRFYKNLDEILSDMIAGMRSNYNIIDRLEEVQNDRDSSFETVTRKICDILADTMEQHLLDIQKINFDLTVLAINEPERVANIIRNTKGNSNFEYLARKCLPLMVQACQRSGYKPKADPDDIMEYISATYVGIEMSCILTACYGDRTSNVNCRPRPMFDLLANTIINLMRGKDS